MVAPDEALVVRLERGLSRPIMLVTVAPELEGSERFIAAMTSAGREVAIGHTAADAETVATGFVQIMVLTDAAADAVAAAADAAVASTTRTAAARAGAAIEIDVAGAIVRATPGSDLAFLAEVVRLLKRLA